MHSVDPSHQLQLVVTQVLFVAASSDALWGLELKRRKAVAGEECRRRPVEEEIDTMTPSVDMMPHSRQLSSSITEARMRMRPLLF